MLTAAAMVCAVPSMAAVGVDDRLLDDVLEPLPDFFFLFLSPSLNKKERRNEIRILTSSETLSWLIWIFFCCDKPNARIYMLGITLVLLF